MADHRAPRRHPAEVTASRLGDAAEQYDFTAEERDMIGIIICWLLGLSVRQRRPTMANEPILCKHSAIKTAGVDICRCEGVCWGEQEETDEVGHPAEEATP